MPKGQKKQRSEGLLFKLIPKKTSQSLQIDNEPVKIDKQPESYRAIGKVDSSLLQGSTTWDIKYLGSIPGVTDWQSPDSRSEFLEMVDEGQRRGNIMWYSAVPKYLCISPLWVNITDHKKKVLYAQFKTVKIGSLSYAEDDGKHVLGIKTSAADESQGYCCHVLECADETVVRNICGYLQDTFQILMSQLQDDKADMEVDASSPPSAPKRKKSRKLSRAEKKQAKLALKAVEKTGHSPVAVRISSDSTHSFDFYKTTDVHNLSDISSINTPRPSIDFTSSPKPLESPKQSTTYVPRPESIIDKQFSFLDHTSSSGNADQSTDLNVGKSQKQRKVGQNMSRHQQQKKSLKADALLRKLEGSLMMHGKENNIILEDDEDDDDEMISPLKQSSTEVSVHSGMVKTHQQLDREGQIITAQHSQYSLPANVKKRASILTDVSYERSTLPLTGKSPSKSKMQLSEHDDELSENSSRDNENGHNKDESTEEPESIEHDDATGSKDDGDVTPPKVTYPPPIIDASLPDLETEITTPPPFYKPPPDESVATEPAASRSSLVTPPMSPPVFKSSTVTETLPVAEQQPTIVEEPSPPPKKQRKPWTNLIDVEDELLDEDYIDYFAEVEKKISVIEYRQLRKNWLDYQKCTTDVVGFCKKTKILLRGADKVNLREGARVLVEEDDRETYDLVLSGDYVPEPERISLTQRRRIAASIKPRVSSARPPPPVMLRAPPPMISLPNTDAGNKTETDVVRSVAQQRPSAKKPEFSKIMKQFEDKKSKSEQPPAAAKKETVNVADDEAENKAEDEQQKQDDEEAERKAKMNQLRQQFENVKKESPLSQSTISTGAVSALKNKFLNVGPSQVEEPAWKKALKKKEVVEEEASSTDSDSKRKHHNKHKKKGDKENKKKSKESSDDEKRKKHHGKKDKDKKKTKDQKKHRKVDDSSDSESDSETDEDQKKKKKKKHKDKKDSSGSEVEQRKTKAKVEKEKEKPPVPFADLPVLSFPAKIEEEQPPPPPPPDSTTETIDALSDLLMGTNTKPEDTENKEGGNKGRKILTAQKSTKQQKSSHTAAGGKKHKTTVTSQAAKAPQPQQQGPMLAFQQPHQQQQQQFIFGTQGHPAANPFLAPRTNPAMYTGPFGASTNQPAMTTAFGNPTLAGNMMPTLQPASQGLQFQQQHHPQLFTLQQPTQQVASKQPTNKLPQQNKTKTTATKTKAAKKSKQATKMDTREEVDSTLDQLALSLSFDNVKLDSDTNEEPQLVLKSVEPVMRLPSPPQSVSTATEPMEIDLIPEIKNIMEPSGKEPEPLQVIIKQHPEDDGDDVIPIKTPHDDIPEDNAPVPPPPPPVDVTEDPPPATSDVPPPPPVNNEEPPASTETPVPPPPPLPSLDPPTSNEAPAVPPPPPPPPPPLPSSDPPTSNNAPPPPPPPPAPSTSDPAVSNKIPTSANDNKLPEDVEANRNRLLEDIRKGKNLNSTEQGAGQNMDDKSKGGALKQKNKKGKKKKKHDSKEGKRHKKTSVSSSEDDNTDDEPQEDDQNSKESQSEVTAAPTPQRQWEERQKTIEPVVEQEDDQSHIVELLDIDIDENLPQWKKKLLQKKKLKEYEPLLSEQQKAKDHEARFMGVPDWKKKLIVKKEEEFARVQRVEDDRLRARREEEEKFNAMPDWKKKLVSLKRADVRF